MLKLITGVTIILAITCTGAPAQDLERLDPQYFLSLNDGALNSDVEAMEKLTELYRSGFIIDCGQVVDDDIGGTGFNDCKEALDRVVEMHGPDLLFSDTTHSVEFAANLSAEGDPGDIGGTGC